MKDNYIEQLCQTIESVGGLECSDREKEGQKFIAFKRQINDKVMDIALFYSAQNDFLMTQFFTSFIEPYNEPGTDFYRVLTKLNLTSVMGSLLITKEADDNYYISFKSNCFILKNNLSTGSEFELFLKSSIRMLSMFDEELHRI